MLCWTCSLITLLNMYSIRNKMRHRCQRQIIEVSQTLCQRFDISIPKYSNSRSYLWQHIGGQGPLLVRLDSGIFPIYFRVGEECRCSPTSVSVFLRDPSPFVLSFFVSLLAQPTGEYFGHVAAIVLSQMPELPSSALSAPLWVIFCHLILSRCWTPCSSTFFSSPFARSL